MLQSFILITGRSPSSRLHWLLLAQNASFEPFNEAFQTSVGAKGKKCICVYLVPDSQFSTINEDQTSKGVSPSLCVPPLPELLRAWRNLQRWRMEEGWLSYTSQYKTNVKRAMYERNTDNDEIVFSEFFFGQCQSADPPALLGCGVRLQRLLRD